ncbi:MAG: transcription elongation factor GreA [Proteobacteria bacterium SG_bin7]|nr:MAG: transcription elongation factor GreA [Proteobacteria bacterium SG_bin7]
MSSDKMPMTPQGKEQLDKELKRLVQEERPAVIKAIEFARSLGDLSENADYEAAKERQAWCEARISEIQDAIARAEVIDPKTLKSDKVIFGAHVTLLDVETDQETTYQLVGALESDVKSGKISVMSPLARAMIGKAVGDTVEVKSPKGIKEYEITEISFK